MTAAHLPSIDQAAAEIREALGRVPGLSLVRVAEVRGKYAAVFEYRVTATSSKGFGTHWYPSVSELLGAVLDTLETIETGGNVNIFSSSMFEYLTAEMMPTDGRPITLTVKAVEEAVITGPRGESLKVVVSFVERPKKLILNKTNARAIARMLGTPETKEWLGASVVLGVDKVKVGRDTVPSIRVKGATAARPHQSGSSGETSGEQLGDAMAAG